MQNRFSNFLHAYSTDETLIDGVLRKLKLHVLNFFLYFIYDVHKTICRYHPQTTHKTLAMPAEKRIGWLVK